MPYMLMKTDDGKICVHKQNEDKSAGARVACHATEAEAKAHMRALYANVPDARESGPIKTAVFVESIDLSEAQIDATNHILQGVVLIRAGLSDNRRLYAAEILQKAIPVFEDSKAYANHPSKSELKERTERSIRDLTGFYKNVRFENNALRADRFFTRNQAGQDAWAIAEDIAQKRAPATLAGLSINAIGEGKVVKLDDGEALRVESITYANSIDDVTTPAAGGSYVLTAGMGDDLARAFIEALSYQEWFDCHPDYRKKLQEDMKTIRQDEALKAAKAETEQAQLALQKAQKKLQTAQTERDTFREQYVEKARELIIEQRLNRVRLNATWKNSLRAQLMSAPEDQWDALIETELTKAKKSNAMPKVPVKGAGQQIVPTESVRRDPTVNVRPRDDEDSETWAKRILRERNL